MPRGRPRATECDPINLARIEKLMKMFNCKTDTELAEFLGIAQPQIANWKSKGFVHSISKIIDELLKKIN